MNARNLLTTSFLCFFVSACGSKYITEPPTAESRPPLLSSEQPAPSDSVPPELPRPTIEPSVAQPLAVQSLPAAIALRDQATAASQANDYSRAIGLLERALRISPDDPQTFHDLARNHLATNQPQQALQLAKRGLTLNPSNTQRSALEQMVARSQASL